MPRKHGQGDRLYVGIATSAAAAEPVTFLKSWTMNTSTKRADGTAFEDANEVSLAGKNAANGTFAGWYDDATEQTYTAANDGQPRRTYLYPVASVGTAGPYWFGETLLDFSASGDVDSVISISGSWSASSDWIKGP